MSKQKVGAFSAPDLEKITSKDLLTWFKFSVSTQTTFQSVLFLIKIIGPAIILLLYYWKRNDEREEIKSQNEIDQANRNESNVNREKATPKRPGDVIY